MRNITFDNAQVKVVGRFRQEGSALLGTVKGEGEGFEVQLWIDSEQAPEKIPSLMEMAHRGCYIENTIALPVPVTIANYVNGREV